MSSRTHNREGFTLIELMIVLLIIGILAVLAIPRFMQATTEEKRSEARTILMQVYTMQRVYHQGNGTYAHNSDTCIAGQTFTDIGVGIPVNSAYTYTMTADTYAFSCTATANLDDDPAIDRLVINQSGIIIVDCNDVKESKPCP